MCLRPRPGGFSLARILSSPFLIGAQSSRLCNLKSNKSNPVSKSLDGRTEFRVNSLSIYAGLNYMMFFVVN